MLRDPALVAGILVVGAVILASVQPNWLAPADPEERGAAMMEIDGRLLAPPYPPSSHYPLGSDLQARDLLSRIIYGTRATFQVALTAALLRIAIGMALGWMAVWNTGTGRHAILALNNLSATVPSLLFAYLVIATIGPQQGAIVFVLGIGLTGWAPWTQMIYGGIQRIRSEPYMEAATAVGSTIAYKTRYYLLPNLLPVMIPAMAQEVAATLLIMAELGFIGLFLGSIQAVTLGDLLRGQQPQLPFPEWAGMLAGTRFEIFRWYWLPIMPALAFAVTIFGLNLLAEGLRSALDLPQFQQGRRHRPTRFLSKIGVVQKSPPDQD